MQRDFVTPGRGTGTTLLDRLAQAAEHWVAREGRMIVDAETELALVRVARAAQEFVATTSYFRQAEESRPAFEQFVDALAALDGEEGER